MHVVFFQPRTEASCNYQNSASREQTWAPWFALLLAPAAIELQLEVELLDARIVTDNWEQRIEQLTQEDVLAVSVMTGRAILDAVKASAIAHRVGAYVIWGGPHATLFPEQVAAEAPVHAVVSGFGFAPFRQILIELLSSKKVGFDGEPSTTRRQVLRRSNPSYPDRIAVSNLPEPALDLVKDWKPYINPDVAIASHTVNLVTSEGCPRSCTFCSEPATSRHTWMARPGQLSALIASKLIKASGATGLNVTFAQPETESLSGLKFHHLPWCQNAGFLPDSLACESNNRHFDVIEAWTQSWDMLNGDQKCRHRLHSSLHSVHWICL